MVHEEEGTEEEVSMVVEDGPKISVRSRSSWLV